MLSIFKPFSHDELALTVENNLPNNHHKRVYTPTKTLSMFLAQTLNEDRSCSKAVNDMLIQAQFVNNTSANTAAYCKARKRLSLPLLTQLVNKTGELIHRTVPQKWRWFGRSVSLIEGTSLTKPDTKSSQTAFPQQNKIIKTPIVINPKTIFLGLLTIMGAL
jgi:hypothetical protein